MRLLVAFLLATVLFAQDDARRIAPIAGRRLALVIGNASYPRKPLANPLHDAEDMAARLRQLGFDTQRVYNANESELRKAVIDFLGRVRSGDLVFLYYSGHGVQVKGQNYLLPVDLPENTTENWVEYNAISAQKLMADLENAGSRARIIVLDACRDNPLPTKGGGSGLAPMSGRGTIVAFATAAGRTANDSPGQRNGLFTHYLLEEMSQPGVPLRDVLFKVQQEVDHESQGIQIPEVSSLLTEDVVLVPGRTPDIRVSPPTVARIDPAEEAWQGVKDSRFAEDFDDYRKAFPNSPHNPVAALTAAHLRRQAQSRLAGNTPAQPPGQPPATASAPVPVPAGQRTDAQIEMDVVNALGESQALKSESITATTFQGAVTLNGTLSANVYGMLAESIVSKVPGVIKVNNHLNVSDPAPSSRNSPSNTQTASRKVLLSCWNLGARKTLFLFATAGGGATVASVPCAVTAWVREEDPDVNWSRVQSDDGFSGWVSNTNLLPVIAESISRTARVDCSLLGRRTSLLLFRSLTEPSGYSVTCGSSVTVIEQEEFIQQTGSMRYKIRTGEGHEGWIQGEYLRF